MAPPIKELLKDLKILYVEDEPEIRESIHDFLRRRCANLVIGANGKEGLELYFEHRPDIVVTDINMPQMNGLEMARRIKEDNPQIQIIVTTAQSEEDIFIRSIEVGINFYVLKPLNRERLIEAITQSAEVVLLAREVEKKSKEIQMILDFQDNIVFVTNGENISACNRKFLDFFGYGTLLDYQEDTSGISSLFVQEESYIFRDEKSCWLDYIVNNRDREHRVKLQDKSDGEDKIFVIKHRESPNKDGNHIVSFTDITEFEMQKKKLEKMAHTDMLTGIYNRHKFSTILETELHKFKRYHTFFSIVMFDIDHFKKVNDTYGHLIGDEVLVQLAQIIRANIRHSDLFARWGGEEFVVLAYESKRDDAQRLAEKLRKVVENDTFASELKITCSFGIAEALESDDDNSLMKRADDALYAAKRGGRNRVEVGE